jgi:hypothetical protein
MEETLLVVKLALRGRSAGALKGDQVDIVEKVG